MAKFTKHIFICGNQRPADHPRGSCDPAATGDLQRAFKASLAKTSAGCTVRANKAGCLDQCEHGPNIVIYPDAVWYGGVSATDIDEIVDSHLLGGKPVARLMLKDECINTEVCEHKGKTTHVAATRG